MIKVEKITRLDGPGAFKDLEYVPKDQRKNDKTVEELEAEIQKLVNKQLEANKTK